MKGPVAMTLSIEVLAESGNVAVVQLPGRNYPALAVQGDTLYRLWDGLREYRETADHPNEDCASVEAELRAMLDAYEEALRVHNIRRPY